MNLEETLKKYEGKPGIIEIKNLLERKDDNNVGLKYNFKAEYKEIEISGIKFSLANTYIIASNFGYYDLHYALYDEMMRQRGYPPLISAIHNNDTKHLIELLEDGEEINSDEYLKGWTPLICACSNSRIECIKILLEHGACVNAQDEFGITPLMLACFNNNIECVKILLEHKKIKITLPDMCGKTALDIAKSLNHTECVKLLLEHQQKLNNK